jgi:DNA polymerase III subunit epsilon
MNDAVQAGNTAITVIDFESTGAFGGFPNEPWQVAMVSFEGGTARPATHWESLLHVSNRPFNPRAPGLHHRLRDRLLTAPRLADLWPRIKPWLENRPVAAHNVSTEKSFLKRVAPLHPIGPWIDTLKLVRIAYPDLRSHTLMGLAQALGLDEKIREACPGREPHDALFDSVACAMLLEHLLALPGWANLDIESLARAHPTAFHMALQARRRGP